MPFLSPAYRGPAIVIAIGTGFAFVGSIPIMITLALGVKTSATIIGLGFVGFGGMVILPGIFWCVRVQHRSYVHWRERRRTQEETSALSGLPSSKYGGGADYPEAPEDASFPETGQDR